MICTVKFYFLFDCTSYLLANNSKFFNIFKLHNKYCLGTFLINLKI